MKCKYQVSMASNVRAWLMTALSNSSLCKQLHSLGAATEDELGWDGVSSKVSSRLMSSAETGK